MDSILTSIKKLLGPGADDNSFNTDIIIHINTQLFNLAQMGVGKKGFAVSSENDKWSEFLNNSEDYEAAKTYIYAKVKLVFDPPTNSAHVNALQETAKECAWRLNIQSETEV